MTPNTRGALLMMLSMAAFTLNDTLVKLTGSHIPLFQLVTLRGALASLLILVLALRFNALRFDLPRSDWVLLVLRGLAEIGATYFFLTALFHMPLATLTAILQVVPLAVTLGAALFFGEPVGWRRMTAIGVGFCGMLLIVRPGPEGISLDALYALASVLCVTLRDLVTRRMSARVPSLTVTFVSAVMILVVAALASVGTTWQPVDLSLGLMIVGAALFVVCGYLLSVLVMRTGDVAFIAPFRYTGLVWALVLGWLVFGDWPQPLTFIGAALVVGSGLFALLREAVVSRRAARRQVQHPPRP